MPPFNFDWDLELKRLKAKQKVLENEALAARVRAVEAPVPQAPQDADRNPMDDLLADWGAVPEVGPEQPVPPHQPNPFAGMVFNADILRPNPPWPRRGVKGDPGGQPMLQIEEGPAEFRQVSERSTRLPRFKLQYASEEECRMRLEGTLVTLQDNMVKVQKITMVRQGGEQGLGCVAVNQDGRYFNLLFAREGLNLRSPDPGYIQIGNLAYYYKRVPARVYKQGINIENTWFSKAGQPDARASLFGAIPDKDILKAFNDRPLIQFDPDMVGAYTSFRLSDRVAIFKRNGGKLHVEHRGHILGVLNGRKVRVENPSIWVESALASVGLEVA